MNTEDRVIRTYVEVLGRLPAHGWDRWEGRPEYYDKDGNSTEKNPKRPLSLDQCFDAFVQKPRLERGMEVMGQEERDAFLEMLRWMLSYHPGDRPSVKQVLETSWMRRWGLPAYNETWRE
jgi:serine/threonine-protein kinase SRPK3